MSKYKKNWTGLGAGLLLACLGHTATANETSVAPVANKHTASTQDEVPHTVATRHYSLSLKQLGAAHPMNLRGADASDGVFFGNRDDEVITAAKLHLRYAYSPSLVPEMSHINVLVNDELAMTLPVPHDNAGHSLEATVDLPAWMIGSYNQLRLQLVGHSGRCEEAQQSNLWANISNQSMLELGAVPVPQANDLSLLPRPFFDPHDLSPLHLSFVFGGAPDSATLEAAGIVASWFGMQDTAHGAVFPVSVDGGYPTSGNAVMFLVGDATKPLIGAQVLTGPTLAVASNPNDAAGKLLLVMGRSPAELKAAAKALVLASKTLSGQAATITKLEDVRSRQPYDAPRWLRSDRPVRLGELADAKVFSVTGYLPDLVRVNVRVPPDLFGWRDRGVPVHLKYRYTPRPYSDKSLLTFNVGEQYVTSWQLLSSEALKATGMLNKLVGEDGMKSEEADVRVPLYRLGGDAQLRFQFAYDYPKVGGACKDVIIDNARSAIDPDSTVDISGYDHWLAMPDLAAFAGMGFPFTRLADLAETTVVMPDAPTAADIGAYLRLMAHMSRSTGYPATGVAVAAGGQESALEGRDLLVIDAAGRQPLVAKWARNMPAAPSGPERHFVLSDLPTRMRGWFSPDTREAVESRFDGVDFRSDGSSGAFSGFESPLSSGRSVVVVSSSGGDAWNPVLAALDRDDDKLQGEIRGSLAVVNGEEITSLVGEQGYYVGHLGWFKYLRWWFSAHPLLLLALGVPAIALLTALAFVTLRARARHRKAGGR